MQNVTLYELAWEFFRSGVSQREIARRLEKDRVTIYRWLKGIKYRGIRRFIQEKRGAKQKIIEEVRAYQLRMLEE